GAGGVRLPDQDGVDVALGERGEGVAGLGVDDGDLGDVGAVDLGEVLEEAADDRDVQHRDLLALEVLGRLDGRLDDQLGGAGDVGERGDDLDRVVVAGGL